MSFKDYLNLTEFQSNAMEELRQRISEEIYKGTKVCEDKLLLYRFLKARDFDTDQAEVMLKKSLQWRRQNEDLIQNYKPSAVLNEYLANGHFAYDKEGCPVFYVPTGRFDLKGLFMSARSQDIEKFIFQTFLRFENQLEKEGRITRFVLIIDDADLTFVNAIHKKGLELVINLVKLQQDIFPERLKAVYIINIPSYFAAGFNVVKHFLSVETQKKIRIHGTEGWKEKLLEIIDDDQLPICLGGTRTDPDGNPLCKTMLLQGGPIDESHYIHRSKNPLSESPDVQTLHVPRLSSFRIPLDVPEPGSIIEWEFETRSGDIGFGLSYKKTAGSEAQVAWPFQRLSTKDFSEVGMYNCDTPGTYEVIFDNSHSWFRSKEIYYRLKVVKFNEYEDKNH